MPGELKWAASPSEGGVSGSFFIYFFFPFRYNQLSLLSLKTHSLPYTHVLALKTVNNRPTDFAMCCCSPSLSANMRLLALCLAQVKAQASLVVGVIFFRDLYYLAEARIDSGDNCFIFYVHLNHFNLACTSPPLLSFPLCFSHHFVGLRIIRELESYFFSLLTYCMIDGVLV